MMKLIVTDIDGTLVNEEKEITPKTFKRLMGLKERGHRVVVASGRIHGAGRIVASRLGMDAFLISCNGAVVKNMLTEEVIYEKVVPTEKALEIIKFYKQLGVYFHVYTNVGLYSEFDDRLAKHYSAMQKELPEHLRFHVEVVEDMTKIVSEQIVHKIGVWSDDVSLMNQIYEYLKTIDGIAAYKSHERLFDVMGEGVSKAEGIKALMHYYDIKQEDVIAFGDNDNDVDMISFANIGIAMANASQKAKDAADFVTLDNDSDGIVYALDKFGIIF